MSSSVKTGTFSRDAAGASFPVSALTGSNPLGPVIGFQIYAQQYDVPQMDIDIHIAPNSGGIDGYPGDPQTDEVFEGEPPAPTGIYEIDTYVSFTYDPASDVHQWYNVNGFIVLPNGLTDIAVVSSYDHPIFVQLTYDYKDPNFPEEWYNPGPSDPQNIQHVESDTLDEFAEPTGDKDQTFTWDLPVESLAGTIIQRDGNTIAVLGPDEFGDIIITYVDTVAPGSTYEYTFFHYYLTGSGISGSVSYPLDSGGEPGEPEETPLVDMTMDGGIDFGGAPSIAMIVNPSGIYGLIPNLTHDVLYERIPTITSVNVKIPDPFAKTGFLPED